MLDAIPDMINLMSRHGSTPIDFWMKLNSKQNEAERFIALFRERGGLTNLEIWQAEYNKECGKT